MKLKMKILAASILAVLSVGPVLAAEGDPEGGKSETEKPRDRISGGARADFARGTLVIPCVKIKNSDNEELEGRFFDVVLKQRGKSFNYEVVFGELEDDAACQPAIDAMLQSDEDSEDSDGGLEDVLGEQLDEGEDGDVSPAEGGEHQHGDGDMPPPPEGDGDDVPPPPAGDGDDVPPPPAGDGDDVPPPPAGDGDDVPPPPAGDGDDVPPPA